MKGRRRISTNNTAGIPTDLLVCFPSRSHLGLIPKHICSPSRPPGVTNRYLNRSVRSQSSPLFRSRAGKSSGGDITDEPTSPTVTCAGQIKVRPRPRPGSKSTTSSSRGPKGWISMVEDLEKLQSKKPLMQFFGALRSFRFDLHCFGSFHNTVDCSTDEEDLPEEEEEVEQDNNFEGNSSTTIFSKWIMLLEDNQNNELNNEMKIEEEELAPPPNALLLMRCRSAPAEGRIVRQSEEDLCDKIGQDDDKEKKDRILMMNYDPKFDNLSTDISKETWVVGKFDPLGRSKSWKR